MIVSIFHIACTTASRFVLSAVITRFQYKVATKNFAYSQNLHLPKFSNITTNHIKISVLPTIPGHRSSHAALTIDSAPLVVQKPRLSFDADFWNDYGDAVAVEQEHTDASPELEKGKTIVREDGSSWSDSPKRQ